MSGSMMDGFIDLSVVGIVEGKPEPEGTTALGLLQAAYRDVTQPLSFECEQQSKPRPLKARSCPQPQSSHPKTSPRALNAPFCEAM